MDTKSRAKLAEDIKSNCQSIRNVLDRPVSNDDISGVTDKLIDLVEIAGLASRTEAVAKMIYEQEYSDVLSLLAQDPEMAKLGSTTLGKIAGGKKIVSEYLAAAKYSERLGRNISHSMDALRSIISLQKEELNQSKWTPGT